MCLWMSEERGDSTYKPDKKTARQKPLPRVSRNLRTTRKDYQEEVTISSGDESTDTFVRSESGFEGSIKSEPVESIRHRPIVSNWATPGATTQLTDRLGTVDRAISQLGMTSGIETGGMERIMEMMLQMQTQQNEQYRRREERDAQAEQLRLEREERTQRETRDMITTLRTSQPAVPQTVTLVNQKLPDMREGEEIETFLGMFEAALRASKVPIDQWCAKLHAHLTPTTKLRVQKTIQDPDSTYEMIREALIGCGSISFTKAAETLLTGDRGKLYQLGHRQCRDKLRKLIEKVTKNATNEDEIYDYLTVAFMRHNLNPTLKTYVDLKGRFECEEFAQTIDEWEATQPLGTKCFDTQEHTQTSATHPSNKQTFAKKPGSCFYCGKAGHFSRDCRSRIAKEKATLTQSQTTIKSETPEPVVNTKLVKKEITCYHCRQKGHKAPQCPLRQTLIKRIQIPSDRVVQLKHNELFGSVDVYRLPITCDTGADLSVVPEECVRPDQFTGETQELKSFNKAISIGRVCNVDIILNGRVFQRRAVTQPGEKLEWTACLNLPYTNKDEHRFVAEQMEKKFRLSEDETLYLPPELKDGALLSGIMVSEGTVIEPVQEEVPQVTPSSEQTVSGVVQETERDLMQVEAVEQTGSKEQSLVHEDDPSVLAEEGGGSLDGSAGGEGTQEITLEGIHQDIPRSQLAQATKEDESLQHSYELAKLEKEGYHLQDDILFRTRLDTFGQPQEQICLPRQYRPRCLQLAHNNFGHQGRTKMVELIRPFFHWPTMTKDCLTHIKKCDKCQRTDKTAPKHNTMQLREVTTIPFEQVSIDLVGPFPTAVGGFRYLLTCIDSATRWPEAIPIRSITAKTIITQLTNIFSRCGFPTALTSDNGSQFTGKAFQTWLKHHGIKHIRSSPYHPQGNGVVERLHRTLNSMVTKLVEKKGNWAAVTPMALYFIRSTPSSTTGLSPFMARQGWEPATPIQVLYKTWAQTNLGDVNLTDWVTVNSERVEMAREKALLCKTKVAGKRKTNWDKTARNREFDIGEEVLIRKPGLNLKLSESWEGPFTIIKKNSPLSYSVDTGDRKIPSVHIQLMKRYDRQIEQQKVARVTSVFESDTEQDDITSRYSEAEVVERELGEEQKLELQNILDTYSDVMTSEPGLTDLVQFTIETGDNPPIFQRPYNTPAAFKTSIDKEID